MNRINDSQGSRLSLGRVRILPRKGMTRGALKRRVPSARLIKGIYLIPSLFTTGNLFCGFFSIVLTFNGQYVQAAVVVILAHLLDSLDGAVARLTKTTSQFGVEFDSLADLVSFGVAPAVLVYYWALLPWGTWGWLAAGLYVVCGALRLARFNVQVSTVEKTHFVGLPIPAAAEMIVAVVLMYHFLGGAEAAHKRIILLLVIYILPALMVSNFRYVSLRQLDLRRRHPFWILLSAILLIKLTIAEPQIMLFSTFLLYTLSGPVSWLFTVRKRRGEKRGEIAEAASQ
ncbi:MAG: CDP-diacylglycerol--serine O-phosphatidyltransferase [Candidatus Binatia bacterium]